MVLQEPDGDEVVRHFRALFDFIPYPRLGIHYAMKANYNPVLLKMLCTASPIRALK